MPLANLQRKLLLILALLLASCPSSVHAQDALPLDKLQNQADLDKTIAALDAAVFDAYNRCADPAQLARFGTFFTEDVEFYHDQTGLQVGRDKLLESIRANICGKVTRSLVPGTLQVHRLNYYGAVELATHRFHHPGDPTNIGEAETVMLWQWKDNAWKITRVISYDHHAAPNRVTTTTARPLLPGQSLTSPVN